MRLFILLTIFFSATLLQAQSEPASFINIDIKKITKVVQSTPIKGSEKARSTFTLLDLPMPSGEIIEFAVSHTPLVDNTSPLYKTSAGEIYSLTATEVAGYNGSMVYYRDGIHATLNTPDGLLFIRRSKNTIANHEFIYYKDTEGFPHDGNDAVKSLLPQDNTFQHDHNDGEGRHEHATHQLKMNGNNFYTVGINNQRHVVDLFITSEKSFVDQYNGNIANATARIVEVVNGVKVVWEQDFNITINYRGVYFKSTVVQAGNNGIQNGAAIYNNDVTDSDVSNGTKADVDLVHFIAGNGGGTPGGGAGGLWVACGPSKADGYSGVPDITKTGLIPLVAHELAHQMGADHTWTGGASSCTTSQWGKNSGVEPGSGVSLAGYAGICGTDDIPGAGKGNFHHVESIREIVNYVRDGTGKNFSMTTITSPNEIPAYAEDKTKPTCITTEVFNNNIPVANANPTNMSNLNIPARTPFELNGSGSDSDNDPLTYQWDELDFALIQQPLDGYATRQDGPLFRSYGPKSITSRTVPKLGDITSGTPTKGEKLAEVSRKMRFALVVRDGKGGVGVDTISYNIVDGGQGFSVTDNINTANISAVNVTWNKANSDVAPISCGTVDIFYSIDGGNSFPYTVASGTANDGSHVVTLPSFNTTKGRIKIKCSTSIFFDISNTDLTVSGTGCDAISSVLNPATSISAASGSASLDLDENARILNLTTFSNKDLDISGLQGDSPTDNGGSCGAASFNEFHGSFKFQVLTAGTYNLSGPSIYSVYEGNSYVFSPSNPCGTGTFIGSNFKSQGAGQDFKPTLQPNKVYTAIFSSQTANNNVTVSISGAGSVIEVPSSTLPPGTSYTFVAINKTSGNIAKVDANADFKSLTAGTYDVFGVSYASTINVSSWIGQSKAMVFESGSTCALLTSNSTLLTVTGGTSNNPCTPTGTKDVIQTDITANATFHNGTITSGGMGSNKVNVNTNNVTFKGVSSVTFNSEFEVSNPNVFEAKIEPCNTP